MGLFQVTPPETEPVSRTKLKLHSRITDDSQDERIDRFIRSARSYAENRLGRQFITATWRLTLDGFPKCRDGSQHRLIQMPLPPLQSVTSITYMDDAGEWQTLSSDNYRVETDGEPGRIQLRNGYSWPTTIDEIATVKIVFVAGYGDAASDVPQDIRHAIEMIAAHFYENREAIMAAGTSAQGRWLEVPISANALLDLHRLEWYLQT